MLSRIKMFLILKMQLRVDHHLKVLWRFRSSRPLCLFLTRQRSSLMMMILQLKRPLWSRPNKSQSLSRSYKPHKWRLRPRRSFKICMISMKSSNNKLRNLKFITREVEKKQANILRFKKLMKSLGKVIWTKTLNNPILFPKPPTQISELTVRHYNLEEPKRSLICSHQSQLRLRKTVVGWHCLWIM